MRKIKKLKKPQILIDNASKWTQEYCSCLNSGQEPSPKVATRYKENTIKSTLEQETHGKCAYCESKIKHITYGDIEHILPKNKNARPDLYVEWDNLTLACEQCNRSGKGAYYDPNLFLINPYKDEPEQHFNDIGPFIMHILGDVRASTTTTVLGLNRPTLVERRTELIMHIEPLLKTWEDEPRPFVKTIIERKLHEEYAEDREFSSTVKAYLRARGFPVL